MMTTSYKSIKIKEGAYTWIRMIAAADGVSITDVIDRLVDQEIEKRTADINPTVQVLHPATPHPRPARVRG